MKKIFSIILVFVLVSMSLPLKSFAKDKSNTTNYKNYLVEIYDTKTYKNIKSQYSQNIINSFRESNKNKHTMVMSLSKDKYNIFKENKNSIAIEEDIYFKAESTGINEIDDILTNTLGNQEQETYSEEYPSNIKMVKGTSRQTSHENNNDNTVKVAILDSGISNHSELNIAKHVSLLDDKWYDNCGIHYDITGHGTSIAGIIGAKENDNGIIGICEGIDLYSIQVLDANNSAPLSRIVEGIDWAIENDIDVLNMSFGTNTNSQILHNAIIRANQNGMVLVAAAGNTSGNTQYPARYPEVISVGSVDGSGNTSDFSANDDYVDIYAPGEGVITTGLFDGYVTAEGTSLATPHVTSAVAIIKSIDKTMNASGIKNLMVASSYRQQENSNVAILDIENMINNFSNFCDSGTEEIVVKNNSLDEYNEDAIMVGSWEKKIHMDYPENFSTSSISTNNIRLMAASAYMADELYGVSYKKSNVEERMFKFYPLHAYGYTSSASSNTLVSYNSNFLADTKYLYRLAKYYFDSPSVEYAETQANIDAVTKAGANYSILQKIVTGGTIYTKPIVKFLGLTDNSTTSKSDVDVKGIVHMNIIDGIDEGSTTARGYKILGLAIHLAGDTYAHRTRLPVSSTQPDGYFPKNLDEASDEVVANIKDYFTLTHDASHPYNSTYMNSYLKENQHKGDICRCYTCFRKAVESAHVEFRDIKRFWKYHDDSTKDLGKDYNGNFKDDSTTFYTKRYTIATQNAVNKLISRFTSGQDFTLFVFLPSDTSYTLKLNCLKDYVTDTGMNWDGLQQSTRDRVIALSTGSLI